MDISPGETPAKLRILICDDHPLMLRGLKTLLEAQEGWAICAELRSGREAVDAATRLRPDVAILDITMPDLNGFDAARRIKRSSPQTKVIINSAYHSSDLAEEAIQIGISAYVVKASSYRDLVEAVKAVATNATFFSSAIREALFKGGPASNETERRRKTLTTREREVLQLLAQGKTTKEVSIHLNLSFKTVETHRANITRKLEVHNVTDLVLFAIRNRMIEA